MSQRQRLATLGEKRNALAELASQESDGFVVIDDDDVYLPWTLQAHAWALQRSELSCPDRVLVEHEDGLILMEPARGLYHSSWAFTRDLFCRAGRYPLTSVGEDTVLMQRMMAVGADPLSASETWPPWFIYRWANTGSYHVSGFVNDGYEAIARGLESAESVRDFQPVALQDWRAAAASFYDADPCTDDDGLSPMRFWRQHRARSERKMIENRGRMFTGSMRGRHES